MVFCFSGDRCKVVPVEFFHGGRLSHCVDRESTQESCKVYSSVERFQSSILQVMEWVREDKMGVQIYSNNSYLSTIKM